MEHEMQTQAAHMTRVISADGEGDATQTSTTPTRDLEAEQLTAQLVQIDSSDPGAYEKEIEVFIRTWLKGRIYENGLEQIVVLQELEALPGRYCLRATIPSAQDAQNKNIATKVDGKPNGAFANTHVVPPANLTFLCHQDTVTLGEGWDDDTPALGAIIKDNKLYGRGSCDMKGGLACALLAFKDALEEVARRRTLPQQSLSIICTVDEEANMVGVEAAIKAGWLGSAGWVIDTEPTNAKARGSHKGRTWFELHVDGVTAHASTPWEGADAVAGMAEAVSALRTNVAELPVHPTMGPSTITFGQIEGGYQPYVVPDHCTTWVDLRLVPPATTKDACALVSAALAQAEQSVPGVHSWYRITGDRAPVELPATSALLAAVQAASHEVCGTACATDVFTGYTDTAVVASTCANSECLSYGPGNLEMAHKPNEYVPLEDLARVRAVLSILARRSMTSECQLSELDKA